MFQTQTLLSCCNINLVISIQLETEPNKTEIVQKSIFPGLIVVRTSLVFNLQIELSLRFV